MENGSCRKNHICAPGNCAWCLVLAVVVISFPRMYREREGECMCVCARARVRVTFLYYIFYSADNI